MKKTIIILSVLMALPAFCIKASAQEESPLVVASSESGVSSLEILSHIGFGYNFLQTDDFTPIGSGEFFVNIAKLGIYPAEAFGIEIGVDYKTVDFVSKDQAFFMDGDKKIQVQPYKAKYPVAFDEKKNFSRLRTNTFSAPVTLNLVAGVAKLSIGAEANLNLTGRIKDKYFVEGKKTKNIERGVPFNRFNYNLLAAVSYNDFGIYFRYYPKNSKLIPEGGIDVSYMTLGVILGL